jgi:hypothetical protein
MWTSSKQHKKTNAMAQACKKSLQLQHYEKLNEEVGLNFLLHFISQFHLLQLDISSESKGLGFFFNVFFRDSISLKFCSFDLQVATKCVQEVRIFLIPFTKVF